MSITSAFLTKLSFSAEKNWHQKMGAKRRLESRDWNMGRGTWGEIWVENGNRSTGRKSIEQYSPDLG